MTIWVRNSSWGMNECLCSIRAAVEEQQQQKNDDDDICWTKNCSLLEKKRAQFLLLVFYSLLSHITITTTRVGDMVRERERLIRLIKEEWSVWCVLLFLFFFFFFFWFIISKKRKEQVVVCTHTQLQRRRSGFFNKVSVDWSSSVIVVVGFALLILDCNPMINSSDEISGACRRHRSYARCERNLKS